MDILLKDPLLLVAVIIGVVSFILIFLLIEYYKKFKDYEFVNEVIKVSKKKSHKENEEQRSTTLPDKSLERIPEKNLNTSDIIAAQINELTNQINNINTNIKDLSEMIKNLSTITTQNSSLSEQHTEKLISILQKMESLISSKYKDSSNSDNETILEINTKLDNILKILTAILQQ